MKALEGSTLVVFAVTVLLMASGCTIYRGEFSVLSTRDLELADFNAEKARRNSRLVEGASERQIYVLIPDRDDFPTLEEAIEKALEQGRGDLILNARVLQWHWYIPVMYGSSGWRVVGEVVDTGSEGVKAEPLKLEKPEAVLAGG